MRSLALSCSIAFVIAAWACGDPYDGVENNPTSPPSEDGGGGTPPDGGEADGGPPPGPPCGDIVCKAHEVCENNTTCKCGPGYVSENNACVWRGGPRDPSFQNNPVGAWVLEGSAGLLVPDEVSTDYVDPGAMHVFNASIVSQSFDMPPIDVGEPFAIDLSSGCPRCTGLTQRPELVFTIAPKKGFANSMKAGILGAKISRDRVCLGEAAYGGKKTITIRGRDIPAAPGAEGGAIVDRLAIIPDPTCPRPGVVTNGDFDGTGGWTGSGPNAEVANQVGTGGTRGARLRAKCGELPAIAGWLSVPLSTTMKRPALSFTWKLPSAESGGVVLGTSSAAFLRGTGVFEQAKLCLPEWTKGNAQPLQFFARQAAACTILGSAAENELLIDDVKIVDDIACPDVPLLFDPSFEQGTTTTNRWSVTWTAGASASIATNGQAHTGNSHLQMGVSQCGASASVVQAGTIPDSIQGVAGPAAKFWYRANIMTDSIATGVGASLTSAPAWTQRTVCLPSIKSGLPVLLDFALTAGPQTNCATGSSLEIDDVELTTDPNCQ